jgi:transposase
VAEEALDAAKARGSTVYKLECAPDGGHPNHRCGDLAVPNNITLLYLPPYSPELNPKENLWDELREKIQW